MKDIKKIKHIEVILGLIIIILLSAVALVLLIKRENQSYTEKSINNNSEIALTRMETGEEEKIGNVQVAAYSGEGDSELPLLYQILGGEKYRVAVLTERKQEDNQLKELYEYWDAHGDSGSDKV